ncbi:MAG TPA: hypothetical protein DGT21_05050 [Armatimonadetes bacterium]|nr:hypothetical protein [Armatimonadota bacterium]
MTSPDIHASICTWLEDAPFAYSMTYDEGTVDALANALPVHQQFGFPGHVDVVAGQLGRQRTAYGSSLNDYMHMSVDELRFLIDRGWGVGNHSWSHYVYPTQPGLDMYREVVWSKYRLEDMLEHPVRIFTIPNDTYNYEPALPLVKKHYLACASIDGSPNRDGFDLYRIGNFMVASGKISDAYDWKDELLTDNLQLEFLRGSWLYETSHLVMWNVPQSHKCITPEDLTRRFETLTTLSGGRLWAAKPDDVIDYVLLRRNLTVNASPAEGGGARIEIGGEWPVGVISSRLSLRLSGAQVSDTPRVEYFTLPRGGNLRRTVYSVISDGADWIITLDAVPGAVIEVGE